jgi:ABC-type sugar transport system ATPase subunit
MRLLEHAAHAGKKLLIVDEPREALSNEDAVRAARLLAEAAEHGATVVTVNMRITQNQVQL